MAGFQIRLGWDKDCLDVALTNFRAREDIVKDLRSFWVELAPKVGATLARNFIAQGNEVQGAWDTISPRWRAWKREHGYDSRILIMTGAMMRAASVQGDRGNIFVSQPRQMIWGVDGVEIPYADKHNQGGTTAWITSRGRMISHTFPQRKFMILTAEFVKVLGNTFAAWYHNQTAGRIKGQQNIKALGI